jgi:hypothetical protein
MSSGSGFKEIEALPSEIKRCLDKIRQRRQEIIAKYKDPKLYGFSTFESVEEVGCVLYALFKGIPQSVIARYILVDPSSLYRFISRIRTEGKAWLWNPSLMKWEEHTINEKELVESIIARLAEKEKLHHISDIEYSTVIREFRKSPLRRTRPPGAPAYYTPSQVEETVRAIRDVSTYIREHRSELMAKYGFDVPSNPDLWNEEYVPILSDVISAICSSKYGMGADPRKINDCIARYKILFRRIKKFSRFFEGEIGAVTRRVVPRSTTLFTHHIVKLREYYKKTDNNEFKAFYDIMLLHIWSGAREGYSAITEYVARLRIMAGAEPKDPKMAEAFKEPKGLDLDHDLVRMSLIGIKWEKAITDPYGRLLGFRIFESKTNDEWILNIPWISWIDPDYIPRLEKIREFAKRNNIRSVIKSILAYYGVIKPGDKYSVASFEKFYSKWVKALKKILDLEYEITPHRLRSAHVSILSEFGVHLEYIVENIGWGVGWDDLNTAREFYREISQTYLNQMIATAERNATQLVSKILAELRR